MLINKTGDMTPFNMSQRPCRQNPLLLPLIWTASYFATRRAGLKIIKSGMEGLKPPFLVLSEHHGFMDYYISPLALFPYRANYISDVEGFAAFGKTLYRQIGCVAKRRHVGDISLIRNILHVTETNKDIIVVYPEARHSNAGTNSRLPESTAKLVRLLGLPVVIMKFFGSYLTSPIWDEHNRRRVPLEVSLTKILDPAQIVQYKLSEIGELLSAYFQYDEYKWQMDNKIEITYDKRAEGLHKVLYQCPNCMTEYEMKSFGHTIKCNTCGKRWEMDEFGRLNSPDGFTEFTHIPDWYEFQRAAVHREIDRGKYSLNCEATIEALPSEKGFVNLGNGSLRHDLCGFSFNVHITGESFFFPSTGMDSVHTEYSYRGKGDCIVLSTRDCCYYLYPQSKYSVTKMQFAAERFHADAENTRQGGKVPDSGRG